MGHGSEDALHLRQMVREMIPREGQPLADVEPSPDRMLEPGCAEDRGPGLKFLRTNVAGGCDRVDPQADPDTEGQDDLTCSSTSTTDQRSGPGRR